MPASWTPEQIKQFQDYWDTEFAGDLARRRRAKFVPGDSARTVHQTKEPQHKDDFDEWLARIVCFAFSVPPQWAVKAMNRATADNQSAQSEEEGLEPTKEWVKDLIDEIIAEEFASPDLELHWLDEDDGDPETVLADRLKLGAVTLNEMRDHLGLDSYANPAADRAMVLTPTGYVPIEANVGGGSGSPDAPLQNAKPALRSEKLALQKASPDDAKHPGWPAGTPDGKGGQFRPKDSGDSSDDNANSAEPNRPVQYAALDTGTRTDGVGERSSSESVTSESNGPSEPTGQQAEQYAQNAPRGGIGGRPTYFYGDLGEPTPAQEARLAVVEARWNDVFAQVRARDPSWKPSPVAYATIEGEISAFEAGIGEAEQRLSDFASVGLGAG